MALPKTITVEGTFLKPDGTPESGYVEFKSKVYVLESDGFTAVVPAIMTSSLDSQGNLSIDVPATDDPDWTGNWRYDITLKLSGDYSTIRNVAIPYDSPNDILSIAKLIPSTPEMVVTGNYIVTSAKGAPNGVASLDSSGKVPAAQLPTSSGGAPTWNDVVNKPTSFVPTAHTHAVLDVTGLQAILDGKQDAGSYAPLSHSHTIDSIVDLEDVLDGKQPVGDYALTSELDTKQDAGDYATNAALSNGLATKQPAGDYATQSDLNTKQPAGDYATNTALNLKAPLASPTFTGTVSGISKTMVGLSNVDNTSDVNKPISSVVQAALNTKTDKINSVVTLVASGDTTGNTDSLAITNSLVSNSKTILGPGAWYISNVGLVTNGRWLVGSGPATVLNVKAGTPGIVLTGPGDVHISDMTISGGTYGIVVNGCYDGHFQNIKFNNQTLGGVKVNGDLATEQHWVDITMRGVGGKAFAIDRTTSIYTGSLYMDRVRIVEPASGATHGFYFNSSAGSPSLNIAFMTQCVADNYTGIAYYANNVGQIFASNCWFAINGTSPANSAAMKIIDGFQHTYTGCYSYSGINDPSVVISGSSRGVDIGGGHVFDGTPSTIALGLTNAIVGGYKLGTYQNFCGAGLTDVNQKLILPQPTLPGTTSGRGEETFSRMFCNTVTQISSGTLVLSFFVATKTELISTIEAMVNESKAGGTYCGYGLYTVSATGTLTLVAKAEQTSSPSLWNSAFQPIGGFDTKLGLSAIYQKVAGQEYAVGALFVGTTGPKLIANLASNGTPQSNLAVANTPLGRLAAVKTGQTTLGTVGSTTHTAASLSGSGAVPYFVLN